MNKLSPSILLLVHAAINIGRVWGFDLPPDETFYETPEVITYNGYPVESHTVISDDGYILTMFRIPHGRWTLSGGPGAKPILLFHAWSFSSRDWFTMDDPEDNLPFMLANAGHDVWLVNARGTRYSRKHTYLTPDDLEYWDFSFHETGKYDIPAMVKYILMKTGKGQISYLCHSMGCTSFVVCIDQYPELNAVFRKVVFLGAATYMQHVGNAVKALRIIISPNLLLLLKQKVAGGRVFKVKFTEFMRNKGPFICAFKPGVTWKACIIIYLFVVGYDFDVLDERKASLIVGNLLEEVSIKAGTHYLQWVKKPYMRQYDYGKWKNLEIYGSPEPPEYEIQKIKVPVLVMYAANDRLTVFEDTVHAIQDMENAQGILIRDPKFNHFDFIYANTAPDIIYPRVLEFLR